MKAHTETVFLNIYTEAEKQADPQKRNTGLFFFRGNVDAPIINEYKLTLECRIIEMDENREGGAQVIGEVVNWSADESILNADGKVDLSKLKPIIFDSSALIYRAVGGSVGQAWHSGKKFQ